MWVRAYTLSHCMNPAYIRPDTHTHTRTHTHFAVRSQMCASQRALFLPISPKTCKQRALFLCKREIHISSTSSTAVRIRHPKRRQMCKRDLYITKETHKSAKSPIQSTKEQTLTVFTPMDSLGMSRKELQCVAECRSMMQCVAVCCSVLQCVAVCCSVLQCVAVCCSVLQCTAVCCIVMRCAAQRIAVCRSVLHSVSVCCSVLHSLGVPRKTPIYPQADICMA